MEPLSATAARVLGCLIEKDMATPEYYPLSLNALTLACNQKTNREPVMALEENDVLEALESLIHLGMAEEVRSSRVLKYAHGLGMKLNLSRAELAILAVLLLRGPQTPGELRQRTSQMHSFDEVEAVLSSLRRMPEHLTVELARQPGWKETRWMHLLSGEAPAIIDTPSVARDAEPSRLDRLERELAGLRAEVAELRKILD